MAASRLQTRADYEADKVIKPLNPIRDYSIVFFGNGRETGRIVRACKGSRLPQELRTYRKDNPHKVITAVPESTLDEDFIKEHGIGIH